MDRQQRYDDMGYPSPYAQYNTDSAYTYDQELSSRPSYNYNQGYTQGRNEPWSPQDSYHTSLREPTSMSYHSNTMHNPSYSQNHTHADPDTGYDQLPVADLPLYELPPQYVPRADRRLHPDYSSDLRKFRNRTVHLKRNKPSDQLGFNVRGGAEHRCGIFISKVMARTDASKSGLQEGDQILFANGESFLNIDQHEAVKSLKRYVDVELIVKYFPYAYDKSFDKCKTNSTFA